MALNNKLTIAKLYLSTVNLKKNDYLNLISHIFPPLLLNVKEIFHSSKVFRLTSAGTLFCSLAEAWDSARAASFTADNSLFAALRELRLKGRPSGTETGVSS